MAFSRRCIHNTHIRYIVDNVCVVHIFWYLIKYNLIYESSKNESYCLDGLMVGLPTTI